MHIPDSAISPATSLVAGAAMLPVWWSSARKLRSSLASRQVPLLAVGAAFCFTIMMFNIPVLGGTTVHAVGSVLMAILLGPWAAVIGVTTALAIQALFFGDGGVLALGVNCFTMAFAMPFSGFLVYRTLAGESTQFSTRRAVAAGVGAYVGVNVAALLAAVVLGVQPWLYHQADGRALYFMFDLRATVPAMMLAHLTVAGLAEAAVTTIAVRYAVSAGISLYSTSELAAARRSERRQLVWVGLGALVALCPLGLLARGEAWGEWDAEGVAKQVGYVPSGMGHVEAHWWTGFHLLPDYLSDRGPLFYILSALVGVSLVSLLLFVVGRMLAARPAPPESSDRSDRSDRFDAVGLPDWLSDTSEAGAGPALLSGKRLRRGFLERTLEGIAAAGRDTLFAERWARADGLLQCIDPRVKVIGLVGCVVVVACLHRPAPLAGLLAVTVILALASRLPMRTFLARSWLAAPIFVGAVVLPAALNIATPGKPLLVLWHHPSLYVTLEGLGLAALLTARVGIAVSFVVLLTLTTPWNELLRGLRVLLIPRVFLVVAAMAYRYVGVLMQAAIDMFVARRSRTVGPTGARSGRRFVGGAIAGLFGKTMALTDEVHGAMVSRGWTGEPRVLRPLRVRTADMAWLVAMCVIAAAAVGGEIVG